MARKKKRRLGHITNDEKQKVRTAVDDASSDCFREFIGSSGLQRIQRDACKKGVEIVERNLNKKGFGLAGRRRRK